MYENLLNAVLAMGEGQAAMVRQTAEMSHQFAEMSRQASEMSGLAKKFDATCEVQAKRIEDVVNVIPRMAVNDADTQKRLKRIEDHLGLSA